MALVFNREFDPRYGEAVEVAPGVRRLTASNASPFTFHGTNTFLIGTRELAVIDPGPADEAHIETLLRAIGGAKIARILVTHTHRDHSPGARLLKARTGAPILAAGRPRTARAPHPGEEALLDATGDLEFVPDVALADGAVIEGDDYRLEALVTPGHTADHLAFALPSEGIVLSGDHVMGWSTTVVAPPDGSMADYLASLDRLLARTERRYLPAHGGEVADGPEYARALQAHRRMREAAILERLRRGDRTVKELVAQVYAGLDPRLAPAAALSTLAHLEHLVERGVAVADGPQTLGARYWPVETTPDAVDAPGSS
jgi:glyoxylase-like metal-dependent hydrolase (beta-lactamase superfamily II)